MQRTYGYYRISRPPQNIDLQERNILTSYPDAIIRKEAYTGIKIDRPVFSKLLQVVQPGDTILFDSVSRMSRNAEEGIAQYMELYEKDVNLVFLKEAYIDTDTYKKSLSTEFDMIGVEIADLYIEATNRVMKILATNQTRNAFDQAEKEVLDLHERTKEGIETARRNGKKLGKRPAKPFNADGKPSKTYQKAEAVKEYIRRNAAAFGGKKSDTDCINYLISNASKFDRTTFSKPTYYKYKAEMLAEANEGEQT